MKLLKLNLGCGDKPLRGAINIDNRDLPGVDKVRDLARGIPCEAGTVGFIYASHVIEHLMQDRAVALITDMHRALAPGGLAVIIMPPVGVGHDVLAFQDPTHRTFWSPGVWTYFRVDHHYRLTIDFAGFRAIGVKIEGHVMIATLWR